MPFKLLPHTASHTLCNFSPPLCRLHGGSRLAAPLVLVLGMQAALGKHLRTKHMQASPEGVVPERGNLFETSHLHKTF